MLWVGPWSKFNQIAFLLDVFEAPVCKLEFVGSFMLDDAFDVIGSFANKSYSSFSASVLGFNFLFFGRGSSSSDSVSEKTSSISSWYLSACWVFLGLPLFLLQPIAICFDSGLNLNLFKRCRLPKHSYICNICTKCNKSRCLTSNLFRWFERISVYGVSILEIHQRMTNFDDLVYWKSLGTVAELKLLACQNLVSVQ